MLTARIEYVMQENHLDSTCDRALLLNYKARSEYNAGDYGKAVKRFRRAVTILEKIPSDQLDERGTALLSNSYSNLAMALYSDNKTHEATAIMQKAVETRAGYGSKNLIESHDTINQMQMIVRLYIKSRQIGAAEEQLDLLENIVQKNLGRGTLDDGVCQQLRGAIALLKKDYRTAEKKMLEAEEIIAGVVGEDNPLTLAVRRDIHAFYLSRGNRVKALEYQQKMDPANPIHA